MKYFLFLIVLISCGTESFSQINYGLRSEYVRTNLFEGIGTEAIIRNKKDNYHLQYGLGVFFLAKASTSKFSTHFQTENKFINKKLFYINEFNLMIGEFRGSGILDTKDGKVISCDTAKLALSMNTGLEYKIIHRNKIAISGNGKIGFGKGLIVKKVSPDCESKNLLIRFSFGILIKTNL